MLDMEVRAKFHKMKFKINGLGYIDKGEIEIKPLTILCGPNNTGKTWAMYALYGCLTSLPASTPFPGISDIVRKLKEEGSYSWDMIGWVNNNFLEISKLINIGCKKRLESVFNFEGGFFEKTNFDWVLDKDDLIEISKNKQIDYRLEIGNKKDALRVLKVENDGIAQITLISNKIPDINRYLTNLIFKFFLEEVDNQNVFLIPAERNGLHLFYRELRSRRNALLHHASRDEVDIHKLIFDVLRPSYAEPIADYIDWLNDIRSYRSKKGEFSHIVTQDLRKTVLSGRYEVDSEGDISFIHQNKLRNKPAVPKMPLHLTSSTIKSLFGLSFFLLHMAKKGDVLMIDEPELNLHPGSQRRIARVIAQLTNLGLKVIVSTHSDYFIREINSLIMLSKDGVDKSKLMRKYKYKESELLDSRDISAYVFDKGEISKMEVNEVEGILADTFDSVINDLNETNDDIYYSYKND